MAVSLTELSKALTSLEEALTVEKTDISRDASIQRFEFCKDFAESYRESFEVDKVEL